MVKTKNKELSKNFIWNAIGTTFSSFNSLFFMIIVTRINGVNDAGIFTFAFSTACLFYVIGIYSGRTFQITDNDKKNTASDYFYTKIITCILMILVALVFCFTRDYTSYKILVIMELVLYKVCEAFSESSYAVIQKENLLYKVGQSMFLKAIVSLILFFIVDYLTHNMLLASSMILIANIIFILLFDFKILSNLKFKLSKFNKDNVIHLLKIGLFTFGFTFLTLYVINAPKYAIDELATNNVQTIFGIVVMPATVLILFGQYIIQPFLLSLKEKLNNDKKQFVNMVLKMSLVILIVGLVCILLAYFLGIPVLELLYGLKLNKYLISLIVVLIGATVYAISVVFSTALTTMRYTLCQFIIFAVTSVFAYFVSHILVKQHHIFGACLAYTLTMLFLLLIYIVVFLIKTNKYRGDNKW